MNSNHERYLKTQESDFKAIFSSLFTEYLSKFEPDLRGNLLLERKLVEHSLFPTPSSFEQVALSLGLPCKLGFCRDWQVFLSRGVNSKRFVFYADQFNSQPWGTLLDYNEQRGVCIENEEGEQWVDCDEFLQNSNPYYLEYNAGGQWSSRMRELVEGFRKYRLKQLATQVIGGLAVTLYILIALLSAQPLVAVPLAASALLGLWISWNLIMLEHGANAGFGPKVCDAKAVVDSGCGAVLDSPLGKSFWLMSIPNLTLGYFLGYTFAAAVAGVTGYWWPVFAISVLAVCVVPLSVFYQINVIKDWCKLCLWVGGILIGQSIVVIGLGEAPGPVTLESVLPTVWCFSFAFSAAFLLQKHWQAFVHYNSLDSELKKIRQSPAYISAITGKTTLDYGDMYGDIFLGNPDATVQVDLSVSLGCSACAITVSQADEFLQNHRDLCSIRLRIRPKQPDMNFVDAETIMDIAASGDYEKAFEKLKWAINASEPERERAHGRKPDFADIDALPEKVKTLYEWCNLNVAHTPLIVINEQMYNYFHFSELEYLIFEKAKDAKEDVQGPRLLTAS